LRSHVSYYQSSHAIVSNITSLWLRIIIHIKSALHSDNMWQIVAEKSLYKKTRMMIAAEKSWYHDVKMRKMIAVEESSLKKTRTTLWQCIVALEKTIARNNLAGKEYGETLKSTVARVDEVELSSGSQEQWMRTLLNLNEFYLCTTDGGSISTIRCDLLHNKIGANWGIFTIGNVTVNCGDIVIDSALYFGLGKWRKWKLSRGCMELNPMMFKILVSTFTYSAGNW